MALGGSLIQHLPEEVPDGLRHEQPNPRHEAGHGIVITPDTLPATGSSAAGRCASTPRITRRVRDPGTAQVSARAEDGVIEAIESASYRFCLGVQWHPEFLIDPGDLLVLAALVEAARA